MVKLQLIATLLLCSLFLLGCIGGAGTSNPPVAGGTPKITAPAEHYINVFVSGVAPELITKLDVDVSLNGAATTSKLNLAKLPPIEPVKVGSVKVRPGEKPTIFLSITPGSAEINGSSRALISPQKEFSLGGLNLPTVTQEGKLEVVFDADASLHTTNLRELAFLPVAEVFVSNGGERFSVGKLAMGVDGSVGSDNIISSKLKLVVSGQGSGRTFKADNTPPQIPLN